MALFGKRDEEKEQEWRLKYARGKTAGQRTKRAVKIGGSFFGKRRRQLVASRGIRRPAIGSGRGGKRGRRKGTIKYRHPITEHGI